MEENKSKEDSLRDDLNKAKNHNGCLINVIVVLTCAIIAMITILGYNKEDFTEQISFASTITSIVLSVIAIIMTVVSGETLNNLLHKFRDLHDDIKDVPSKFEQTTDRFEKSCKELETVQKDLERLPDELINTRKKVEELSKELSATHGDIKVVDLKFDDLKNGLLKSESKEEHSKTKKQIPNEFIDNLFNMSYTTVRILYALYVAYKTKTTFNIDLVKDIDNGNIGIVNNFLGIVPILISFNIIETKTDNLINFKIDNMSPYLCSKIKNELLLYFKDMSEKDKEEYKRDGAEAPEAFIERINKLFGYTE